MRKLVFVVVLASLFAVPCFAAEVPQVASSEVILEQLVKAHVAEKGGFLLLAGREKQSPVLLAAAAELFAESNIELESDNGIINADSIYKEAVAVAKAANNTNLADALEGQKKEGDSRWWMWTYDNGFPYPRWYWYGSRWITRPHPNRPGRFLGEIR